MARRVLKALAAAVAIYFALAGLLVAGAAAVARLAT